jgi:mono/diheme cytochrome c family protein
MKRTHLGRWGAALLVLGLWVAALFASAADPQKTPRFELAAAAESSGSVISKTVADKVFSPKNAYNIFINYELGMHCVGFDISYCCVIPPYNSIQAQVVKAGLDGALPNLLGPEDKVKLRYFIRDNSYSEGNKMKYWSSLKDANGSGTLGDPNDNIANYVWTHLFIYKDLAGTIPPDWTKDKRLHVGLEIPVLVDHGPSGKALAGGYLDYAGPNGGNIVFTDTLIPAVINVPLKLTASYVWDALGLPLTAFSDSRRKGTIRSILPADFQPFQYSTVQLQDDQGQPIMVDGRPVEFFGTNPVDLPNCFACHSGKGIAAQASRGQGLKILDQEYAYWKNNYPDITEFMARQSQAQIDILELHDWSAKTDFLRDYRPEASSNRLGEVGAVNCADCHGDNISGNLQTPRPGAKGYKPVKARPLSESVHGVHMAAVPLPDGAGRPQNCQACHPTHWQNPEKNDLNTNPHQITDDTGRPRFSNADQRTAGGGCYLRRDAMTNPRIEPPFFLNAIGRWFLENVSTRDEKGQKVSEIKGLTCTNCHNLLTQALYAHDNLKNVVLQVGTTLRNKPLPQVIQAVAGGNAVQFADYFADPKVKAANDPLGSLYNNHPGATLVKAGKDDMGNLKLMAWNAPQGDAVPYPAASGGSDWWLAASEPHCANCHLAPFVESEGGSYFPIDQPNKYSLYRYSKAHGNLACQSCHESIHGLYPVRYDGDQETVDLTSHQQALQFSPDGKYAGPVTCAACHTVNAKGVPVQLKGTDYYQDHWASVVLAHFMRSGDQELSLKDLIKKYPYRQARQVAAQGWK